MKYSLRSLMIVVLVTGILQVDPKKLPGKGKLTTKAAKKGKKKSR